VEAWRKSTYSGTNGGDCVEVGNWRKSTHSDANGGACVEAADSVGAILVRDTTNRDGGTLAFGATAWERFLGTIK
jgi:hypothetical protein